MTRADIIIVGGGMAGASLGAALAERAKVVILEMEDRAGYHATGRSAAFWEESYGGPLVQPLTTASGPLLAHPAPDFAEASFLSPRGTLHIGRVGDADQRDAMIATFGDRVELTPVDPAALVPGLRPEWTIGLLERSCQDIDVAALHHAYLRQFRRRGGEVRLATALRSARRVAGGWEVESDAGAISAAMIVNAAGAWADRVAAACGVAPVGIMPLRRTMVQLRVPGLPSPDLPLVMDMRGQFYFKPEGAGRLWLTPHDEDYCEPGDVAAEEMAVAVAMDRFAGAVDWTVAALEHRWAGLRSFAPDRAPVYGFEPDEPGFFWFAGQGGFGIQTAPAAAMLAASLIDGRAVSETIASIDATPYSPARFR
ncbi:D-arginine dehydrogenase [Sphingobium fontiphilum]|uniref:D-arginine dehydrogenase n=1 Tax=Sphingobium fontiphilum TaxID=944425 RepID=A0A7W6GN98_9SPHN|nr:FAD-binding oxidoreductase [Sphingobium fontiphilum]MBB3981287.1 D-arginine dehydrogenase [Sphingobium fontiphilum]